MKLKIWLCTTLLMGCLLPMLAQQRPATEANIVPPLVNFSGTLSDVSGRPFSSVVGVTFLLYKDQDGGAPLWMETQNVEPDKRGHYSVMLGSTSSAGLPSDIFAAGQARWLGVQVQGQAEQPRVLLLSVPYALKAGDAATVGGLPPSAFMLALPSSSTANSTSAISGPNSLSAAAISGTGTTDFVPLWTNSTTLGNSVLFQSGTGTTAKVGINTTTPASALDVKGGATVRGSLSLPATATATSATGFNSQPITQAASSFNSSTAKAATQTFQWQAEPAGNNTSSPSGTLNLLFGSGASKPSETGLHIANNGQIAFAVGQTFPGTGNGTITGVTAGTDLTGGGASGNVTLNLDTTKVPQLGAANTFTSSQTFSASIQGQTASFVGSNNGTILQVSQNSSTTGAAVAGVASGTGGVGVEGSGFTGVIGTGLGNNSTGVSGTGGFVGVSGTTSGTSGLSAGVFGQATASTGSAMGVIGESTSGIGIFGRSNATSGTTYGVQGINNNAGLFSAGVEGESFATSGTTFGLVGSTSSPKGIGAVALADGESAVGLRLIGCCPAGVWGDTASTAGGATALAGTAGDARAIYLENNSPSGVPTAFMQQDAAGNFALVAGGAGGFCTIDTNGHEICPGNFATSPSVNGGQRQVALYAVSSPQNWFEDFGSGQLASGAARITLEPTFAETVNTGLEYHVFLTPKGDCHGLYVSNETVEGFEVHELGGAQSNVAFDYRIVALRRGYESVRMPDMTERLQKATAPMPKATDPRPAIPLGPSVHNVSVKANNSAPAGFGTKR